MSPLSTASLDPILAQVGREREAQLRHFDALDTKAGVILGFAGALVALAPSGNLIVDGGRALSVVSGLLALWTFWPRSYPVLELRNLRNLYLAAEPEFTELHLLDVQVEMAERGAISLVRKAWRLKLAMSALAIGAVLTAVGLGVD
jgi:hypothetical protein